MAAGPEHAAGGLEGIRCPECGATTAAGQETILDEVAGLPITLARVTVHRCPRCPYVGTVIDGWIPLLCAIAGALIRKPVRLAPEEIRFLRRALALSKGDLAGGLRTTPHAVTRWEHGDEPISPAADRLLRLMVAAEAARDRSRLGALVRGDFSLERLVEIDDAAAPVRAPLRLTREARGWCLG